MNEQPPMFFKIHIPEHPLLEFIENIIYYSGYCPPHSKDKLLPDGHVEMVIDLTDTQKHVYDNRDLSEQSSYRRGWLSGIRKEFITIESAQNSSMMVVRFRPGRALPFFGIPLSEFENQVVEMESIWGSDFLWLREEIIEATTPSGRIAVLEKHLLRIAHRRLEFNQSVDHAVKLLSNASGLTIAELRNRIGFSHRHLVSLFHKHVGIGPKYYSRLMKFQTVLAALELQQKLNWTWIAQDCGYYDQAHFINEFRQFSGLTPTSYLGEKGEYLNYIPIH